MNNEKSKFSLYKVDTERGLIFISTKEMNFPSGFNLEKRIMDVELERLQVYFEELFGEKPLNCEDMISTLVAKHGFTLVDVASWSCENFDDLSWQMLNYQNTSKRK